MFRLLSLTLNRHQTKFVTINNIGEAIGRVKFYRVTSGVVSQYNLAYTGRVSKPVFEYIFYYTLLFSNLLVMHATC